MTGQASLQVHIDEVVFTSGATEANNLVIQGVYDASLSKIHPIREGFLNMPKNLIPKEDDVLTKNSNLFSDGVKNPHIITSSIDHSAILEPIRALQKKGCKVSFVNPNAKKIIPVEEIGGLLTKETILISLSLVNSELGTIASVRDIARAIAIFKKKNNRSFNDYPYLHMDASQATSLIKVNPNFFGADFVTFDGAKMYAPKGIGALVALRERKFNPILFGGGQEKGIRPGTPNVIFAYALGVALSECYKTQEKEFKRLEKLQKYFEENLKRTFPNCRINGGEEKRLPSFVNVCIPGLDAEYSIVQLDLLGVAASSASACQSIPAPDRALRAGGRAGAGGAGFSYIVQELPNGKECSSSSIRFSLGRTTKKGDLDQALQALLKVVTLQKVSFHRER